MKAPSCFEPRVDVVTASALAMEPADRLRLACELIDSVTTREGDTKSIGIDSQIYGLLEALGGKHDAFVYRNCVPPDAIDRMLLKVGRSTFTAQLDGTRAPTPAELDACPEGKAIIMPVSRPRDAEANAIIAELADRSVTP